MITGFHHVGITVSDLDRSLRFYLDVLGLEILMRRDDVESQYVRLLVGIPDARLSIAMLTMPGGGKLELVHYQTPPGSTLHAEPNDIAGAHIALQVADIEACVERLTRAKSPLISMPQESPAGPSKGMRFLYCRDPDGVILELVQPAA